MLTFGTLAVLKWPPCGDMANVTVPSPFFTWPPCGDKANVTVPGPFFTWLPCADKANVTVPSPVPLHGLCVEVRRM